VLAITGIGSAGLVMIAVSAAGPSQAVVTMPAAGGGPPWWIPLHPPAALVTIALWAAAVAGTAGVAAGLLAVQRGARPPARLLVTGALLVTAVLAVLPPAGSTDTLDYAAYGRMVATGHDPYLMTALQLRETGDPVAAYAPIPWQGMHSLYGPLATIEQGTAAVLGGTSVARITLWLKLWNALAFALVVLALDRLLRSDPGRRARAHLLWSVNPLLLWGLVASGHVDAVATAVAFLGLALVTLAPPGRRGVLTGLAAGALVGMAADIKITFVLFGLGIAIAARRSWRTLLAAGAGALAVLLPSYLWFGTPAIAVLFSREASATGDNLYQLFYRPFGLTSLSWLIFVVVPLLVAVAALLLRRLPDGFPARPAVRPALALSLAWLLVWPYQRPWYDAMALCLLALYPATRLDWPVLVRLAAVTVYTMPGMPGRLAASLAWLARPEQILFVPVARLGALLAVVVLCLTGAWTARRRAGPTAAAPAGPPRPVPRRPVSARIPAASAQLRAARSHADALPAPASGGAGQPGTDPPDPG
jgi:hypothetical protein